MKIKKSQLQKLIQEEIEYTLMKEGIWDDIIGLGHRIIRPRRGTEESAEAAVRRMQRALPPSTRSGPARPGRGVGTDIAADIVAADLPTPGSLPRQPATVDLYGGRGVPEVAPSGLGRETIEVQTGDILSDATRTHRPWADDLTREMTPEEVIAVRRGVAPSELDEFDRAMAAIERRRAAGPRDLSDTVALSPEEAAEIMRLAGLESPHAGISGPSAIRRYADEEVVPGRGGAGFEGGRAAAIGHQGDIIVHPPAAPAAAAPAPAAATPRSGGGRSFRLDQDLDIAPPEGSRFATSTAADEGGRSWRRLLRPANIARAAVGGAGLGAGLEALHHHYDIVPDWGYGPWADDVNRFLDTSPTFGMAGSEGPYSERAEYDAIMDAARDAGAYERERRGLFGGGPWDLTRYFRDPVARDVPVEGYEGGSGTQDFQPARAGDDLTGRSPRLSGESDHVWHTPAGGYQLPVPGTGQFGEQEDYLRLRESRSNEGSIESLCNMIDKEVDKIYKK